MNEELKKLLDAIAEQGNQIKGFQTNIDTRFTGIDNRLKEMERMARPRRVSLPGVELEKDAFSFLRAINAIKTGNWKDAGFEREVFEQTEKRAMSAGTGTAGGYIVPSQYVAEIIELLMAETVVVQLGATVLNNLVGSPVEFPKQTGGATAYWVGENADITASDLTLGQLQLTPKAVAALVKLSNRLLKLSNPSAEAMVRRDIASAIALKLDLAALRGSGTANEPLGIANTPNILTLALGTNGGTFTLDSVTDMEGLLEDANALKGALGFAWHGKIKRILKKTKVAQYSGDTAGQWQMLPMSDEKLRDTLGYGFGVTSQIPTNLVKGTSGTVCSEVYFGNWRELIIGQWGGVEIMASNETSDAFQKNQTWVRIIQEVDIGVRHPESFALCSDAKTA